MFRGGAEVEAEAIMLSKGWRPEDRPSVEQLSVAHLGTAPAFANIRVPAALMMHEGKPQIVVREGTHPRRARWYAAHELGHWWCRDWPQVPALEAFCDAIAVGLVVPRNVFPAVWRSHRGNLADVARAFGTTQSVVLLRVGEVLGIPAALVRPRGTITRGPSRRWPRLSWGRTLTPRGMIRMAITDEDHRAGFLVPTGRQPHA